MRKILLLALVLFATKTQAQTTAHDFTHADCNNITHNLYSELDSGNVVVLEFVMMNCSPCVVAANGIKPIIEKFKSSNPGQVRFYSIGYREEYTCEDLNSWKSDNGFNHTVFPGMKDEVDYYGGMGMPTVVVLGQENRKVFYKKIGYSSAENTKIEQAINLAISTTSISENKSFTRVNIFPNPASQNIHISFGDLKADKIQVTDMAGRIIISQEIKENTARVNIAPLENGIYQVQIYNNGNLLTVKPFVKN